MHRERSASRGHSRPKSAAKDAPNLQPNIQEPNAPAKIEKSRQQSTEVRLLRLLLILEWLGQTWPGLKELAHDLLTALVRIAG